MVRTPSCDMNGMKKGTWTPEEDRKLVAYVTRYGCWNWRQLPKFADLKRCGKSCRLRWMNYLRPNLKRGNYTNDEEKIIIKLHKSLGNKWSAIAAQLPGRTDNEVKNHWHTHLKKRVSEPQQKSDDQLSSDKELDHSSLDPITHHDDQDSDDHDQGNQAVVLAPQITLDDILMSPQQSSSSDEASTLTTDSSAYNFATEIIRTDVNNYLIAESNHSCVVKNNCTDAMNNIIDNYNPLETYSQFGDDFWREPFLADDSYLSANEPFPATALMGMEFFSPEFEANCLLFPDGNLYHEHHDIYN